MWTSLFESDFAVFVFTNVGHACLLPPGSSMVRRLARDLRQYVECRYAHVTLYAQSIDVLVNPSDVNAMTCSLQYAVIQ